MHRTYHRRRRYPLSQVRRLRVWHIGVSPPPTTLSPPTVVPVDTSQIQSPDFVPPVRYEYYVYNSLTGEFRGELPVTYCAFTHVLNGPGGCELHWPVRDNMATTGQVKQKLTSLELEEYADSIAIIRNGVCVWMGFLGRLRVSSLDNRVSAVGIGFWDYFRGRKVRVKYSRTNIDVLQVVRELVDAAQTGNASTSLDVLTGSELSGKKIDVIVQPYDFKIYGDLIEDLARSEDFRFDFRIETSLDPLGNPVKQLRLGAPKLGSRREFVAEWGKNVYDYRYERDGEQRYVRVWGIGAGEGSQTLVVLSEDTTAIGRVPLREGMITRKEIPLRRKQILQAIVDTERRRHSQPIEVLSVSTTGPQLVNQFIAGDSIKVVVNDGFTQVDTYMRVLSYTVRVQESAQETMDIELGPEWATGGGA